MVINIYTASAILLVISVILVVKFLNGQQKRREGLVAHQQLYNAISTAKKNLIDNLAIYNITRANYETLNDMLRAFKFKYKHLHALSLINEIKTRSYELEANYKQIESLHHNYTTLREQYFRTYGQNPDI